MRQRRRASKKWYRGVHEQAELFMARWRVEEENKSSEHRVPRTRDAQSRQGEGGGGGGVSTVHRS